MDGEEGVNRGAYFAMVNHSKESFAADLEANPDAVSSLVDTSDVVLENLGGRRATRLGVDAVKSLSNGETGVLVGYQKNEVTRTPLADIVGRTKPVDRELVELARILAK